MAITTWKSLGEWFGCGTVGNFKGEKEMMKKLAAAVLSMASLCASASNGPFDGIYADPRNSKAYITVMQSGSAVISTAYYTIPSTGVYNVTPAGTYNLTRSDIWDLFSGSISGNVALLTGEIYYGACLLNRTLTFDASGVTVYDSYVNTTAAGYAQNIRCGLYPFGPAVRFQKVF